jgi:hypothetical protein
MQSSCLRLRVRKLLVSLAMESTFSREGLQALEEGDDMLTAMARELVTENGIGESASAVRRQVQAEHTNILAAIITPEQCARCRGYADNVAGHAGPGRRRGRQSSEPWIAPVIGTPASAAK